MEQPQITGIFDSHAHYDDPAFDPDRDQLLAGLGEMGVSAVMTIGADLDTSRVAAELAERFAQAVREDIHPRDSWRAAKDFRLHIAVESAKRAFLESVRLAGGEL